MEMMRIALTMDRSSTDCFPVKLHLQVGNKRIELLLERSKRPVITTRPIPQCTYHESNAVDKIRSLAGILYLIGAYESAANWTPIPGLKVQYSTIELRIRELGENRTPILRIKSPLFCHWTTSPYPHLWIYPFLWIHRPCQIRTDATRFKALYAWPLH